MSLPNRFFYMPSILTKAAVRRQANASWRIIVGERRSLCMQKMAMEYLIETLQCQLCELLRACAHMKRQCKRTTTHPENIELVRNMLFSQIPRAPDAAHIKFSLSQNSLRRMCREQSLTMAYKIPQGTVPSITLLRCLLCDITYAILLVCVTVEGPVSITEAAIMAAVRHLHLYELYNL